MITTKLKQILTDSGCTLVIYESDQLANLQTDVSNQFDVVGIIFQQNTVQLEVRANAIHEHYNPLIIEVLHQVRLEDTADNNEIFYEELLRICKVIVIRLINDATFKTIRPFTASKVLETKYDANFIGWSMSLDLYYLKNETRNPCL